MGSSPVKKSFLQAPLLIHTAVILLEGLILGGLYWLEPSSAKNAWIMGLSREKLLAGGAVLLLWAGLCALFLSWVVRPAALLKAQAALQAQLGSTRSSPIRQALPLGLSLLAGLSCAYLAAGVGGGLDPSTPFQAVFSKMGLLAAWLALAALQGLALLWACAGSSGQPIIHREAAAWGLVGLGGLLTGLHWATLLLQLRWPYLFDQFVWSFSSPAYFPLHLLILAGFTLLAFALLFLPRSRRWAVPTLLALAAWFYGLQMLAPLGSPAHLDDNLARYSASPISHVLYSVCSETPAYAPLLRSYDRLLGDDFWLGTKPPGYVLFYTLLRDASSAVPGGCAATLPRLVFFLFPLLSALCLLPLAGLARQLDLTAGLPLAGLLLFSLPNMLFFSLIADQALYPLLFTLTLWLTLETTRRASWRLALLLGGLLYLDIFLSFSLLPLLGFVGLWWLFSFFNSPAARRPLIKLGLWVALGFGGFFILFYAAGGYNAWTRYQNAFSSHRAIKPIRSIPDFLSNILLNNFEFIYWAGVPACLLAATGLVSALRGAFTFNRERPSSALFAACLAGTVLVLNLLGQTRGEVGRLWLFLGPCLALLAGSTASRWPRWLQAALVAAQMLTVFCVFQAYFIP